MLTLFCVLRIHPAQMIVHIFQYPVILLLRNHIYKAKKALDLSKFDQHNLKLKTDEWVTSERFTFDPMCNPLIHQKQKQKKSFEQTLLWVHQNQWQREILTKYGNTMSLIDATYKTTLYDVPLFFIAAQ